MLKRSQSRPRARLARSLSSPPSPSRKHPCTGHVFIFLGAFLLLGSVVFLQVKLGSVGASFRRDRASNKHDGFSQNKVASGQGRRAGAGAEADVSSGIAEKIKLIEETSKSRDKTLAFSGFNEKRVALETLEGNNGNAGSNHEGSDLGAGAGFGAGDEGDKYDEDEEEKVEDVETDMELEPDEMEDLDNVGDATVDGIDDTEDEEEIGKEQLGHESKTEGLKAAKNDGDTEPKARELAVDALEIMNTGSKNGRFQDHTVKQEKDDHQKIESKDDGLKRNYANANKGAANSIQSSEQSGNSKFISRLGGIKTIPRWDRPEEQLANSRAVRNAATNRQQSNSEGSSLRTVSKEKAALVWDHLLGVARRAPIENLPRKFGFGSHVEGLQERDASGQNGSVLVFRGDNKHAFSSDDEPVDEDIRQRLEEVTTVEDALLLKGDKASARNGLWAFWSDTKKSSKSDSSRKEKSGKVPFDPLYPLNNPLLQDPDTYGPSGLTKSDKAILKALRKNIEDLEQQSTKQRASSDTIREDVPKSQGLQAHAGEHLSGVKTAETADHGKGSEQGKIAMMSRHVGFDEVLRNESTDKVFGNEQQVKNPSRSIGRRLNQGLPFEAFSQETGSRANESEFLVTRESDSKVAFLQTQDALKVNGGVAKRRRELQTGQNSILADGLSDALQNTITLKGNGYDSGKSIDENKRFELRISDRDVAAEVEGLPRLETSEPLAAGQLVMKESLDHSHGEDSLSEADADLSKAEHSQPRPRSSGDRRRWGFFPGLDSLLSFSEFLGRFLDDGNCSLRVFMAWTTPPWSYTVRYQRGLESLLYFHPRACVVVFSETIDLDFFKSFVADGYNIAVVMPNLEELLEDTPADVFASVWLSWRKIDLYYIHYTELLRLAALYKYGGIYLDSDVIVLRPLNHLRNTVGVESLESSEQALNGAILVFDKSSPILKECLTEFTASYEDHLLHWNGAGLLERVVNISSLQSSRNGERAAWDLKIQPPFSFFPLSSKDIIRYFAAPADDYDLQEQKVLFQMILSKSHTVHFWNHLTRSLVPEAGSLVDKIVNYHCLRCSEYL